MQDLIPTLKENKTSLYITIYSARYQYLLDSWGVVLGEFLLGVIYICKLLSSQLILNTFKVSQIQRTANYDLSGKSKQMHNMKSQHSV